MIFSRVAARQLVEYCSCPSVDSPDDMIIGIFSTVVSQFLGMCAQRVGIPMIHSAAFHQARPLDYSELYSKRIKPISFHKFEELDPYEVYMNYLHEDMPKTNVHNFHEQYKHTEL